MFGLHSEEWVTPSTSEQELDNADEEHSAWWDSLVTICDEELSSASRQHDLDKARLKGGAPQEVGRRREIGVHSAVDSDIQQLLSGESDPFSGGAAFDRQKGKGSGKLAICRT